MNIYLETALRACLVYALMLVILRVLGKREIGAFSPFDFLVALMLGEIVDEMIYGDVPMLQGMLAAVAIAAVHFGTGWLCFHHEPTDKLMNGRPRIVVEHGELRPAEMRRERLSKDEVLEQLRLQGIDDIREVRMAIVEVSGKVSVLLEDWARSLRRCDIDPAAEKQRLASMKDGEVPPPYKNTTSPESLQPEPA